MTEVHEQLAVIIEAIPAQILAGHLAALAGVNADSFRTWSELRDDDVLVGNDDLC